MADYLETFYKDHAEQARQHEAQRERMTNLVLAVTGVLVGLVTFGKFALWTLPAALTVAALGVFGFFFAGKHYERNRYHAKIMGAAREEMDRRVANPTAAPKSLAEVREVGEAEHYREFVWPRLRGTRSKPQADARSWIARQRVHVFWEVFQALVALLGVVLVIVILVKSAAGTADESLRVRVVADGPVRIVTIGKE